MGDFGEEVVELIEALKHQVDAYNIPAAYILGNHDAWWVKESTDRYLLNPVGGRCTCTHEIDGHCMYACPSHAATRLTASFHASTGYLTKVANDTVCPAMRSLSLFSIHVNSIHACE